MKAHLQDNILFIAAADLPPYKKGGSMVRNSYFWALKAIACHAPRGGDWEFDEGVWLALARMLMAFSQSGYLGYSETILGLEVDTPIPEVLRAVATML
jgi:hypothetical protein